MTILPNYALQPPRETRAPELRRSPHTPPPERSPSGRLFSARW